MLWLLLNMNFNVVVNSEHNYLSCYKRATHLCNLLIQLVFSWFLQVIQWLETLYFLQNQQSPVKVVPKCLSLQLGIPHTFMMMSYQYKFQDEDQTKIKGSVKYVVRTHYMWRNAVVNLYERWENYFQNLLRKSQQISHFCFIDDVAEFCDCKRCQYSSNRKCNPFTDRD